MNHQLNRPWLWHVDVERGGHWVENAKDQEERDKRIKLGESLIQPLTIIRMLWCAADQQWQQWSSHSAPELHTTSLSLPHVPSVTSWQCSSDTGCNKSVPLCQSLAGVLGPEGTHLENKNLRCHHLAPQAVFHASLDRTGLWCKTNCKPNTFFNLSKEIRFD